MTPEADKEPAVQSSKSAGNRLTDDSAVPLHLLAGCIAHDLSSPLTYIRWDVEALARLVRSMHDMAANPPDGMSWADAMTQAPRVSTMLGELPELLEHVHAGLDRLQQLSADLTLIADLEQLEQPVDLRDAVRAALRLCRPHVGRRLQITTDLAETPLMVVARSGELIRLMMKLAFDRARHVCDGQPPGDLVLSAKREGPSVVMRLEDNLSQADAPIDDDTLSALVARQGGTASVSADASGTRIQIAIPSA